MDSFGCLNCSLSLFYFYFVTNLRKKTYGVRKITAKPPPLLPYENPFPADYFKINNKEDNPNRFILFLT